MTDKPNTPKATILLTGDEQERFSLIREHMVKAMPGITPTSADVMRHALYLGVSRLERKAG